MPIINNRIVGDAGLADRRALAAGAFAAASRETLDRAAHDVEVDFIGGFSAQVEKGMTRDRRQR